MASSPTSGEIVPFGEFEANLRSRELLRNSSRVRLPDQSFQVLIMLLEHPGDLVTRDEIRQRLWPAGTFVDFDHGLNNAINRLREALGDAAETPRFIETLPRRGYRFLVPVKGLVTPGLVRSTTADDPTADALPAAVNLPHTKTAEPARSRIIILMAVTLAATVLVVFAARAAFVTFPIKQLGEKDPIVIADFTNTTGDALLNGTLRQALALKLEESPFLNVVSDQKMNTMLRLTSRPSSAPMTPEVTREVCLRMGSKAMISGSIAQLGSRYLLALEASNCATGDTLARAQREASGKDQILSVLGRAAAELRGKLGESLSTLERFDRPLEQATTSSIQALQAYTLGWKTLLGKGSADAVPFFKQAIELDPTFAQAHSALGVAYGDLEEPGLAVESFGKAFELRDKASERERFYITANYRVATGQLAQASTAYQLWIEAYPRDPIAHGDFGDLCAMLGQYDRAIEETREAIRLDQDLSYAYGNLMAFYVASNREDLARGTYMQARERKLDAPYLHLASYLSEFLDNDTASMAREVDWISDKPGEQDELLSLQATTEAYYGRLRKSVAVSSLAVASARRAGKKETAGLWLAAEALLEVLLGDSHGARKTAAAALRLASNRDVHAIAAMALARAGDTTRAEALARELSRRFPLDSFTTYVYVPTINAQIELRRGNTAHAIEELRNTESYELAQPIPASGFVVPIMYPVYLRGEAYLMLHDGRMAAAEFQKILQHRGLVANSPVAALAHRNVGRAYALSGDNMKARSAYQDFFGLWKDADPDIPMLKFAKAEYATLNRK